MNNLTILSNQALVTRLKALSAKEKTLTNQVVNHLAEMIRRRLYAELGYVSIFDYAVRALGYSKASANRRTKAAKVIAKFPEVYPCLMDGKFTLSVLEVVAEVLNTDKARDLLAEVEGKSREEALRVAATYFPVKQSTLCDRIEPIVVQVDSTEDLPEDLSDEEITIRQAFQDEFTVVRSDLDKNTQTQKRVRIEFVAREELRDKIDRAMELLLAAEGHASLETVFERGLDEFLKKHCPRQREERRQLRQEKKLEKERGNPEQIGEKIVESLETLQIVADEVVPLMPVKDRDPGNARYPSLKLRDKILERDGHCCTYIAPDGTKCTARSGLQIDHIIPWALGGRTEQDNLRTTCKTHNQMFARKLYGDDKVDEIIRRRRPGPDGRPTVYTDTERLFDTAEAAVLP